MRYNSPSRPFRAWTSHSARRSRFRAPIRLNVVARSLVVNSPQFSMCDVVQSAFITTGPNSSKRIFSPNLICRTGTPSSAPSSRVGNGTGSARERSASPSLAATTSATRRVSASTHAMMTMCTPTRRLLWRRRVMMRRILRAFMRLRRVSECGLEAVAPTEELAKRKCTLSSVRNHRAAR
jgi:hypothetical protein